MEQRSGFFNYYLTKKILLSVFWIVVLGIIWFLYIFFSKYNNYKPRVSRISQSYTLDIDFDKLNLFQNYFFKLKDIEYKANKELLYKIYDWPVLSNWYDKIKYKIIEWKKQETESVSVVKKRIINNKSSSILQKLKELKNKNKK